MGDLPAALLLVSACLVGLLLVPFGLPGLWVMVLGVAGYGWLTDFRTVTLGLMTLVLALAVVGEVVEAWLGFRFARRYGGSRRAGWGALVGGLVGAVIGVPVPLVGPVIGGFLGAFAGAALFEYTRARQRGAAAWAGWGAVLGRAAAAAAKMALGIVIAVSAIFAALGG
ncbi:MAG: DUF456 domain-containing protein [Gemmatimonadales bacterium]|nr:DUF456 domain-containing protein [Gemmatimonadales bacterium]